MQAFDPNNPPYAINNGGQTSQLDSGTIAMDAEHFTTLEYNVHNMFGLMVVIYGNGVIIYRKVGQHIMDWKKLGERERL